MVRYLFLYINIDKSICKVNWYISNFYHFVFVGDWQEQRVLSELGMAILESSDPCSQIPI